MPLHSRDIYQWQGQKENTAHKMNISASNTAHNNPVCSLPSPPVVTFSIVQTHCWNMFYAVLYCQLDFLNYTSLAHELPKIGEKSLIFSPAALINQANVPETLPLLKRQWHKNTSKKQTNKTLRTQGLCHVFLFFLEGLTQKDLQNVNS